MCRRLPGPQRFYGVLTADRRLHCGLYPLSLHHHLQFLVPSLLPPRPVPPLFLALRCLAAAPASAAPASLRRLAFPHLSFLLRLLVRPICLQPQQHLEQPEQPLRLPPLQMQVLHQDHVVQPHESKGKLKHLKLLVLRLMALVLVAEFLQLLVLRLVALFAELASTASWRLPAEDRFRMCAQMIYRKHTMVFAQTKCCGNRSFNH